MPSQERTVGNTGMPPSSYNMYFHNVSLLIRHYPILSFELQKVLLGKVCVIIPSSLMEQLRPSVSQLVGGH